MNEQRSLIEAWSRWIKHSVMLKLGTITFLMLLLLIPSEMIQSIIYEREMLSSSAIEETSASWANQQVIKGPILSVPLYYEKLEEDEVVSWYKEVRILPSDLHLQGDVTPKTLRRGIYEVVVYESQIMVVGRFDLDIDFDREYLKEVQWTKAFMTFGISDLRGIKEQLIMNVNGQNYDAKPGGQIAGAIDSGVKFDLKDVLTEDTAAPLEFRTVLNIQGSQDLQFVPLGGVTTVALSSSWADPSFDGAFLPDDRTVSDNGFEANWKVLELNRNFPQTWTDGPQYLDESAFGVRLLLPLDDYQKAMRSAKYGMMVIALTFLIFFLVEMLAGRKIHPFQYALVGLAICLFYILLISLSEHIPFNPAYLLSAMIVVAMVTLYSQGIFRNPQFTLSLMAGLTGVYGFLFVTLQVADYALLMGSVGLTVLLSCTMYFTRKVDWYNLKRTTSTV